MNINKVEAFLAKDRRVMVQQVAKKIKVSLMSAWKIMTIGLGLVLRCVRWVPKVLSPDQMKQRKNESEDNLYLNSQDPDFFQGQIVTGDETYLHHYDPPTKR